MDGERPKPTNTKERGKGKAPAARLAWRAGLPKAPLYEMVQLASSFVDQRTIVLQACALGEIRLFSSSVIRTRKMPSIEDFQSHFKKPSFGLCHSRRNHAHYTLLPCTAHARTHARATQEEVNWRRTPGRTSGDGEGGATFATISRAITAPRDVERHNGRWRIERWKGSAVLLLLRWNRAPSPRRCVALSVCFGG